jgi:hypothetical protein
MTATTTTPATANATPATTTSATPTAIDCTVSYIAKPSDSRCKWWSVRIPAGYCRGIDLDNTSSLQPLGFLAKKADLELDDGEMIIDSEANHHAKRRGYTVQLLVVAGGELWGRTPSAVTKSLIKQHATPEQWQKLRRGSGDVAACLRLAMAIELFSPAQLRKVWRELASAKYGPEAQPEQAAETPEAPANNDATATADAGPTAADLAGEIDHASPDTASPDAIAASPDTTSTAPTTTNATN